MPRMSRINGCLGCLVLIGASDAKLSWMNLVCCCYANGCLGCFRTNGCLDASEFLVVCVVAWVPRMLRGRHVARLFSSSSSSSFLSSASLRYFSSS